MRPDLKEPSARTITTVGLDIARSVFWVHGKIIVHETSHGSILLSVAKRFRSLSLPTIVGREILVGEYAAAIRKGINNFDLGLTSSRMADITGGGKVMVGSVEFGRILCLDGLVYGIEIRIKTN